MQSNRHSRKRGDTLASIKYKSGSSWVDAVYPVNSVYMSKASTSPASLFGGSWTQITNAVLRGAAGYGYGGSDSKTLSTNEIPSHNHSFTDKVIPCAQEAKGYGLSYGGAGFGDRVIVTSSGSRSVSTVSTGGGILLSTPAILQLLRLGQNILNLEVPIAPQSLPRKRAS